MAPFDRARPLWEATLVEGLPDGRAAYLLKLHHSLADGKGLVQHRRPCNPVGHLPHLAEAAVI